MNRRTLFFLLAVAAQILILAAVPAQKIYTRATGKSVMLKIRPVDPYNILSGYYVTLNYEITDPSSFPGAKDVSGNLVYAIIEKGSDGVWHPVSLTNSFPANLPENRLAIRGRYNYWRTTYGIEEFFIPEDKRDEIEKGLRENRDQARAEIKVDSKGNAALVRLLIGDHVYDN
ncbi:MAG: GDYXXLXY domain-containing protein [Acidobacteria bacterium]|nr:GDYXXLXY domain-containing protein [Acidobacteriota bacterium]